MDDTVRFAQFGSPFAGQTRRERRGDLGRLVFRRHGQPVGEEALEVVVGQPWRSWREAPFREQRS